MRKCLWIICMAFCLCSCSSDESKEIPDVPTPGQEETAPLTILAYLVANNNLDDDLLENVVAMYHGMQLLKKTATLLIYWDGVTSVGVNGATHAILKFETDGKGNINGQPGLDENHTIDEIISMAEVVKEYQRQVSTSENVMSTVLKDMVALSPTERLGLIFGSHGSAWLNTISTSSRSFGQDGSFTENTILLPNMVSAIKSTGKTFDFLLFDACYMGTVEVCYDFRDVADYQIVSVMEVPAYGFPYNTQLTPALFEGTVPAYTKICQEYIAYYTDIYNTGHQAWATVALVDSKEMNSLAVSLKHEIVTHKNTLADYDVSPLQEYGKSSGPNIAFDMRQFVKELNEGNVPTDFDVQLNKTILYKGFLEKANPSSYSVDAENFCGLGIYIPVASRPKWNEYFKTIEWFTVAGWNDVTFAWEF